MYLLTIASTCFIVSCNLMVPHTQERLTLQGIPFKEQQLWIHNVIIKTKLNEGNLRATYTEHMPEPK